MGDASMGRALWAQILHTVVCVPAVILDETVSMRLVRELFIT